MVKRLIIASCLMLMPIAAQAAPPPMQGRYNWSVGFDVKTQWAAPNGPYWNSILREYKTGASIYLADRFSNIWSFEFGYSWTDRSPKSFNTTTGEQWFGATANSNSQHQGKIRFKDTYLDFYAHMPIARYVELMAGLGVGFVREGIEIWNSNPNDPVSIALNQIQGRTEITARVNAGLQALWTDRIGVRLLFSYETLSHIRMRYVNIAVVDDHLCNDSYTVLFGIYWNFMAYD